MKRKETVKDERIQEAAALKYDAGKDRAPRVTALGKGYLAQRMLKEAENARVQVVQDEKLSAMLQRVSVGDEIPESLYQVVAEILVFLYRMDDIMAPERGASDIK
jgi:flagellar biosynthesis protein